MKKINIILIGFAALYFAACSGDEETTLPPSVTGSFVTALAITNGDIALADVGATATVSVSATPANADGVGYYEYSSGDTRVFTVSADGVITATGQGSAVLSVVAKNNAKVKATCKVIVAGKTVETITIAPAYKTRTVTLTNTAQTFELGQQLAVAPAEAYNRQLKYTSLDPEVATVNENGRVTAVWEGETKVIAEATDGSGISDTCYLTVNITPVTSVVVGATYQNFYINNFSNVTDGETIDVTIAKGTTNAARITVAPTSATRNILSYTSSNESVATVATNASNGLVVTPKGSGRATINIGATDGYGATTTAIVNVYGILDRKNWKITGSSADGSVAEGDDTWGGPIANAILDDGAGALIKPGAPGGPAAAEDAYFIVDLGQATSFDYVFLRHTWSGGYNSGSRTNRISLYGSSNGADFTEIQTGITASPAYNIGVKLAATSTYRYVKAVIWNTTNGYNASGTTNQKVTHYILRDFMLGIGPQ